MSDHSRDQDFLEALWRLQRERRLSDAALAAHLAVDRTLLAQARRRGTLGKTLLVAACDRFPELLQSYYRQTADMA